MNREAAFDATANRVDSRFRCVAYSMLLIGLLIVLRPSAFPPEKIRSQKKILAAIADHNSDVKAQVEIHLAAFPDDPVVVFAAAEMAAKAHDHEQAIALYKRLPEDRGHWQLQRELGLAKRSRVLGHMLDE